MENRVRRNLAAGVISPLLVLAAWLVAAEPSLHIEAADGILRRLAADSSA